MSYSHLLDRLAAFEYWLLALALFLVALWALIRFSLVPLWRRRQIFYAKTHCPSLNVPLLPKEFDHSRKVPSKKSDQREYRLNLYRMTCTCHRFRTHRRFYPHQDIRRLCRHLRRELEITNVLFQFDELIQVIIFHRVKDRCYGQIQINGANVGVGFSPRDDHARVYARRSIKSNLADHTPGDYDKFTLLMSQEIWIYGEAPHDSTIIIPAVINLVKGYRRNITNNTVQEIS